jgi:hypothetical protein
MAANLNNQFSDYKNKYNVFKDYKLDTLTPFLDKFVYYNKVNNILTLSYFD